jgi:hypothetical protein
LDRDRPAWVEAMAAGPFGETITFGGDTELSLTGYRRSGPISAPIGRTRAALPGNYRLVLYPDETHVPQPGSGGAVHLGTCPTVGPGALGALMLTRRAHDSSMLT